VARVRERFPRTRIVELGENRGPSAARNAGLREAESELVLLVDDDLYVKEDAVEILVRAFRQERPAVVCPRIRLLPERDTVQADGADAHFIGTMTLRNGFRDVKEAPPVRCEVGACGSGCMLVDRAAALAAGGFDELYFFYFEDLEFSLRLRALGHRIVVEPAAETFHDRGEGTPGLAFRGGRSYPERRAYLSMRNRLFTILIHYRLRTIVLLMPALFVYEAAALAVVLKRGWGRQWAKAWGWQLRNRSAVRERRRRVQSRRVRRDRELLSGGQLPVAREFLRSGAERTAFRTLSALLDGYWSLARRWIG